MKRLAFILCILMLFSLAACGRRGQDAPDPTDVPTEAPTEAPTAEPTEAPTPEPVPTEKPDFSGLIPRTGKLCEGPIFPEPGKYLVISGEGDNFYVYNNMGELIKTFKAVEDEYAYGSPGIYGEEGICEDVRIATGEKLERFSHLGDVVFTTEWKETENDWGVRIEKVMDADFNELFSLKDRPELGSVGRAGGILHVGDEYLILDRQEDWKHGLFSSKYNAPIRVLGKDGKLKREIDPELFPRPIAGVFGGRYLICGSAEQEEEEYYFWEEPKMSLWDLDGKLIMDNVRTVIYSTYAVDDECSYGLLMTADYIEDRDGNCYDAELNSIEKIPDGADRDPFHLRYGRLYFDDCDFIHWGGVYAGTVDGDRNWLFRIYDPKLASDRDNEHYWD